MRLFNQIVAARRKDHLLVVDVDQAWDLPHRSAVTPQLIGVDDLRNVIFIQKPGQEGFRGLGVAVALQQNFEHEAVLMHCSSAVKRAQARCSDQDEPVSDTIGARTHLVQMPPATPAGLLVAQVFCEQGTELDTPFAQRPMEEWRPHAGRRTEARPSCPRRASVHDDTDLNAALMEQFLHVPVAEQKAVVEPDSLLGDYQQKLVAIGFGTDRGGSA